MPDTPLTEILGDFRSYRPGNHREFLEWVKSRAQDVGLRGYAVEDRESAGQYAYVTIWQGLMGLSVVSACLEPSARL